MSHFARAVRDVRHGTRGAQRGADCGTRRVEAAAVEIAIDHPRQIRVRRSQTVGVKTDQRGVMLVHTMDGYAVRRRPGRLGQGNSPGSVGFVENPGPIHRANHHRRTRPKQHVTDRFEGIVDGRNRFDPTAAARVAKRRRDVETNGRDLHAPA